MLFNFELIAWAPKCIRAAPSPSKQITLFFFLVAAIPDAIEIDISDLSIGQFVYIKDLRSDDYTFLAPDNSVVVGVKTARAAVEEEIEDEEGEEGETEEGANEGEATEKSAEGSSEESKEG